MALGQPVEKACPIVVRQTSKGPEVLAFRHPSAGKQFVKGTIKRGEQPVQAAERELVEESGIVLTAPLRPLGAEKIGQNRVLWHFFAYHSMNLPDIWRHKTADDCGHIFEFFWHPFDAPLNADWHADYHDAFNVFANRLIWQ